MYPEAVAPRKASKPPASVRAAIYTRISDDREGEALGVKRQRAACEELCASRGWTVAAYFEDNDVSAWDRRRTRPGWVALLEAISRGEVDAVVALRADRLHRQPRDLENLLDTCQAAGVTRVETVDGTLDFSTPQGEMVARVLAALAKQESDIKSSRTKAKARELALAGKVGGGGTRPFGYKNDRTTHHPAEARVIRKVVKRVLAGESVNAIANWLNSEGIKTPAGKEWTRQSLRRMVLSPRIAGLRQHQDSSSVVGEAAWRGIISPELHYEVRRQLLDKDYPHQREPLKYLLTGIVLCSTCGGRMVSHRREDKPRYLCRREPNRPNCGQRAIVAAPLEALVTKAVLTRLATRTETPAHQESPRLEELQAERADIAIRLNTLAEKYAEGDLSAAEWSHARKVLISRDQAAADEIAECQDANRQAALPDASTLAKKWSQLTLSKRRAVVTSLVDAVVISPGVRGRNTFDPQRVEIVWRV